MKKIIYITGGERSGKSTFAQELALKHSDNPVYLATARTWDDDFKDRIKRHKELRNERWTTIEEEKNLSKHDFTGKVVVLDCITLWLNNFHYDNEYITEKTLIEAKAEFDKLIKQDFTLIVISNELGMGPIAERETTRKFIELQGWINQHIAKQADEAYMMVSGISLKIK
ncbi:MAG: bifunctional adenosylcobinamide kinase/adenosylcobinamide-phosphate guanylyltransferase [Bacteroidales bacterium]|jgi:adenosylcobinamide kinase/adenosylcobinamide-phosphate guanylyltransferase